MEGLGVAASVAGVVSLAGQTIQGLFTLHNFFKDVASASRTIGVFLNSINKLIKLIEDVKDLLEDIEKGTKQKGPDLRIQGLARQLEDCSENVYRWLHLARDHHPGHNTGTKACFQKFYVAGKKEEVRGTLEEIKQFRLEITSSLDVLVKATQFTQAIELQNAVAEVAKENTMFFQSSLPHLEKIDSIEESSLKGLQYAHSTAASVDSLKDDLAAVKHMVSQLLVNGATVSREETENPTWMNIFKDYTIGSDWKRGPASISERPPTKFYLSDSMASDDSGHAAGSTSFLANLKNLSDNQVDDSSFSVLKWLPTYKNRVEEDHTNTRNYETQQPLTDTNYTISNWEDSNNSDKNSRSEEYKTSASKDNQAALLPGTCSSHQSSDSLFELTTRDLLKTSLPLYPAPIASYLSRFRQLQSIEQHFSLLYLHSVDSCEIQQHLAKLREQSLVIELSLDKLRVRCMEEGHSLDHIDEVLTSCKMLDPSTGLPLPKNNNTLLKSSDVFALEKQMLFHEQSYTKRDRINKWLFQNLQTFPENEELHRSFVRGGKSVEELDRKTWARTVLKFWSIDEAATGRGYEVDEISTNGVAESLGSRSDENI